MKDGFVKVSAASPVIRVADCEYNAERVIEAIEKAKKLGVKVLVFPELTLTGVTCGDLLGHRVLLDGAARALEKVVKATSGTEMLVFVGLPLALGGGVYSVAAAVCNGDVLAFIPRENVRGTLFSAPSDQMSASIDCSAYFEPDSGYVPFHVVSRNATFPCYALPELRVAVEIGVGNERFGADTQRLALNGATLIAQMASFPQTVTSSDEARENALYESRLYKCGLVLAAPGRGESTTDNSYSGLCLVAENGELLAENEAANGALAISEIDVQHMTTLRRRVGGFEQKSPPTAFDWCFEPVITNVPRRYRKHPQLPDDSEALAKYCERMLDIQVSGLVKRMEYAHLDHCVVGISGGVDSTLAVLVSSMAVKRMGLPLTNVVACTMPCFGTSSRTKSNAVVVAEQIGAEVRVIDISASVYQHFDDIGHAHDDYSIAFENAQARVRTMVLMDIANKVNGLDVGTEDLSEYIDGWCTYNGDHTSMYDVNLGMTKTQVRAAVSHIAAKTDNKVLKAALYDVLDCPVTPELLPIHDDLIEQKSEDAVGSYSLQDFFTHKILVCGFDPIKTLRLSKLAYGDEFTDAELVKWLKSYSRRLFSQQFKRSCLMDGPAVESFSVSPRTGLHMPSDGECTLFLRMLEEYRE